MGGCPVHPDVQRLSVLLMGRNGSNFVDYADNDLSKTIQQLNDTSVPSSTLNINESFTHSAYGNPVLGYGRIRYGERSRADVTYLNLSARNLTPAFKRGEGL